MNESEFNARVDDTLLQVEEVLDEAESDLDYTTVGGVLTVRCESGAQVIFTRQGPALQLWLATPGGGFHFDFDSEAGDWRRDTDGRLLSDLLAETFNELAGEQFSFEFDLD